MAVERQVLVDRILGWGYGGVSLAAVVTEVYVHYCPDAKTIFDYCANRASLPPIIANHIGNFNTMAAIAAGGYFLGEAIKTSDTNAPDAAILNRRGRNIQYLAVAGALATNLVLESGFIFRFALLQENMGDAAVGALAVVAGLVVAQKISQHMIQRKT